MDPVFCDRACSRVGMQQAKHKGSPCQELRLGSGAKQNCGEGVSVSCLVQVNRNERVFQQTFEAPFRISTALARGHGVYRCSLKSFAMSSVKMTSKRERVFSRREVEALIAEGRSIIVMNGKVLKVDAWLKYHPGGVKAIMHMIGRDATDEVTAYVADRANRLHPSSS
jgi:hypothetical protein